MKKHRFVMAPKIGKGRKSKQMKPVRKGAKNPGASSGAGSRRHPY